MKRAHVNDVQRSEKQKTMTEYVDLLKKKLEKEDTKLCIISKENKEF